MSSGKEAVVEVGTIFGEVFNIGVLPPVAVQGSEDEAVEDAFGLCQGRWAVEIAISFFLVGSSVDGSL